MSEIEYINIGGVKYDINAVASVNNGTGGPVKQWTGLREEYDAIDEKDENMYYCCYDTGELYLGVLRLMEGDDIPEWVANTSLSNITPEARATFQYYPFSVNNGTDENGQNVTLHLPEGSQQQIDVAWSHDPLTSNGVFGIGEFAVDGTEYSSYRAFKAFDADAKGQPNLSTYFESNYGQSTYISWWSRLPIKITSLVMTNVAAAAYAKNYSFGEGTLYGSEDGTTWIEIARYTNTNNKPAKSGGVWTIDTSNNLNYYNYYKLTAVKDTDTDAKTPGIKYKYRMVSNIDIVAVYQQDVTSASLVVCDPCLITTADGRNVDFTQSETLEINDLQEVVRDVKFKQPVLSANGTPGGDSFAVFADTQASATYAAWKAFDNNLKTLWESNATQVPHHIGFYNPVPLKVESLRVKNWTNANYYIRNYEVSASNDGTNWERIRIDETSAAKNDWWVIPLFDNNNKYYKYWKLTTLGKPVSGGGMSYKYAQVVEIDIDAYYQEVTRDGNWKVLKDAETGKLSLASDMTVSGKPPLASNPGESWLDTSRAPLRFNLYDGTQWVQAPNKVYVGDIQVEDDAIVGVNNPVFNKQYNGIARQRYVVESSTKSDFPYWYVVYSDGWCEQGGVFEGATVNTASTVDTVYLIKEFSNSDYFVTTTLWGSGKSTAYNDRYVVTMNTDSFTTWSNNDLSFFWVARGWVV